MAIAGCSGPRAPATEPSIVAIETAAATQAAAPSDSPPIRGGWSIEVTSVASGVNPALFDTPEKKAKALYDHAANAENGVVHVEQRTLGKRVALDPPQAKQLEEAILSVDWPKMKMSTDLEEAQVGGTIFRFKVTVGGQTTELKTGRISKRPRLKAIVDLLKHETGAP